MSNAKEAAERFIREHIEHPPGVMLPVPRTFIIRWSNSVYRWRHKRQQIRFLRLTKTNMYLQFFYEWLKDRERDEKRS